MWEKLYRILRSALIIIINVTLGLVGEYFGYPVLDKIGIVFAAALLGLWDVIAISVFTPVVMASLLRDPLFVWRVPSYIIYALFLYTAITYIREKTTNKEIPVIFMAILFIGAGFALIASRNIVAFMAGFSLLGFGILLLSQTKYFPLELEIPKKFLGFLALIMAPLLLVAIDLALYSVMFVNIFDESWFYLIRGTLVILMIDSAGPLIVLGAIWLALDMSVVLKEVKGKTRTKVKVTGVFILLILVAPVTLYGGYGLLSLDMQIEENIKKAIENPQDWFISTTRMSYIWMPLGASGVVYTVYYKEHANPNSRWYQSGLNFYVVQGKTLIDLKSGKIDLIMIQKMIQLHMIAILRQLGVRDLVPTITMGRVVGTFATNITYSVIDNITIKTVSDDITRREITLNATCYVSYLEPIGRSVMILLYAPQEEFGVVSKDLRMIIKNFDWL